MTYGPLWALLSAALSALGALLPGSAWGEALVFKLFLAGCWVGLILLTDRVLRDRSPWERCFGLAIAGWLPLGPVQAVAEGHNDALVVVLLALWVTGFRGGTLGLVASALCKYVTAPLLLLERPVRWTTAAAATVLTVLSFAPFLRSLDMFDSALRMRTWRYLTLREAGLPWQRVAEGVVGGDWGLLPLAGQLLPVLVAVWFVIRWWGRRADPRRLGQARLAVLLAVMLSGLGHLWPWFVLWALPLAALDPPWWLSRLWLAIALAIPFAFAFVIHGRGLPDLVRFDLSSLALYLGVGACFMILPARWFPARSSGTFPAGTG